MTDRAAAVAALLDRLEALPTHPSAAMQVLWMAEDNASPQTLAAVVATDPTLTARIMCTANSAYFGLSGRVSSAAFAITVLGFSAVRAVAAAAAAGLTGGEEPTLPVGFWSHAAATATSCALVAESSGDDRNDAFSLGLLHDLGRGLLHRVDPDAYDDVCAAGEPGLLDRERERFGVDHPEAAAIVLRSWRFPGAFVEALAAHHGPTEELPSQLARTLVAGEAVAELALQLAGGAPTDQEDAAAALSVAGLEVAAGLALAQRVLRESGALAEAFDPVP